MDIHRPALIWKARKLRVLTPDITVFIQGQCKADFTIWVCWHLCMCVCMSLEGGILESCLAAKSSGSPINTCPPRSHICRGWTVPLKETDICTWKTVLGRVRSRSFWIFLHLLSSLHMILYMQTFCKLGPKSVESCWEAACHQGPIALFHRVSLPGLWDTMTTQRLHISLWALW